MNQPYRKGLSIAIILILLMALGVLTGELSKNASADRLPTNITAPQNVAPIRYQGEDGKTALELLQRNHTVETIDSSFGQFVRSVDGVAVQENAAWIFYINGEIGQQAPDQAITQNNQTVEWRYESF